MKAVMLSIQPKWCELIASGKKTVEVRKTKPKLETPFKCYIYCTTDKRLLRKFNKGERIDDEHFFDEHVFVRQNTWIRGHFNPNQKVIGEFVCDKIVEFRNKLYDPALEETSLLSCVDMYDLVRYIADKGIGYGWHITDLVIYDKPKELSEFYVEGDCDCMNCRNCAWFDRGNGYNVEDDCNLAYKGADEHKSYKPIKRPFQSWGYVEEILPPLVEPKGKTITIPKWEYKE